MGDFFAYTRARRKTIASPLVPGLAREKSGICLPIFPLVLNFALQIELIAVVDDSLLDDALSLENQHPNHAVAVSSISVETDEIILFNPNTDEELTKYSIISFIEAWRKSNNYLVVINTTDKFVYEPSPIGLDDVELSDDLTELQEAIAENAHEIWAKNRKDQGWSYGSERNDQKKETPDMIPYCNLPESEKLYDREMAMQTLKLVKKLGWELKKI